MVFTLTSQMYHRLSVLVPVLVQEYEYKYYHFGTHEYEYQKFSTRVLRVRVPSTSTPALISIKMVSYQYRESHCKDKDGLRVLSLSWKSQHLERLYIDMGPWFNIKMSSYQYRKSHCGDKTISRPSYRHNGISYTGKMTWLYSIRALIAGTQRCYTVLTHWGRVTHICVNKLTIIGSGNGLSPGRRQAIIWTNAGILLIGPLVTNFSEILIEMKTFSFKKMHSKISSGKWRPSCLGLNELTLGVLNPFWETKTFKFSLNTELEQVVPKLQQCNRWSSGMDK